MDEAAPDEQLTTELEGLWAQFLPLTEQRIDTIRAVTTSTRPDDEALETVRVAAHALVGALGLYGLREAAAIAQEIERRASTGRFDADVFARAADDLTELVHRPITLAAS